MAKVIRLDPFRRIVGVSWADGLTETETSTGGTATETDVVTATEPPVYRVQHKPTSIPRFCIKILDLPGAGNLARWLQTDEGNPGGASGPPQEFSTVDEAIAAYESVPWESPQSAAVYVLDAVGGECWIGVTTMDGGVFIGADEVVNPDIINPPTCRDTYGECYGTDE